MRTHVSLAALALFTAASACGGNGTVDDIATISGQVTDAETGGKIAGAIITTQPDTERVMSDAAGHYTIAKGTKRGTTYQVTAMIAGYGVSTVPVTLKYGDNQADVALPILRICIPNQKRCGQGTEAVETCNLRGNGWDSAACAGSEICDATTGTALCTQAQPLTVMTSGSGGGVVLSTPAGITCDPTCTKSFPSGTNITLTANPFALAGFAGWSGDCTGTGECTLTMDRAHSVTARFDTTGFLLTINKTGRGRVTSTPMGINCGTTCQTGFADGAQVVLHATPGMSSTFAGWSGGGCSGTADCTVTMDADRTVEAHFMTPQFALDVTRAGSGAGVISSNPAGIDCGSDCNESFDIDTMVTLHAEPNAGSTFAGWSGDCSGTDDCMLTMSAAHAATATFDGISHPVTVMKSGTGAGTVSSVPSGIDCGATCSASFGEGQMLQLTAAPAAGSAFTGWSGACAPSGMNLVCMVTVAADLDVGAAFDVGSFNVTVAVTGGGSVSSTPAGIACGAMCSASFGGGTSVQFTATPNAGFVFSGWGGACAASMSNATCTIAINAATSITASFDPFYLARLPADASCTTLLHFDAPTPLAQGCGGGANAVITGTYGSIPSRSTALGTAISAQGTTEEAWVDTLKLGPVPTDATIELTIEKVGPAFMARGRGVLYSNRDALDPTGPGVRLYVTDDGRLGAETSNGAGGTSALETPAGTITDGAFHHVAATLSSSTGVALFVDAASISTLPGPALFAASSSTAWAGAEREGPTGAIDRFNGAIDELRVSTVRRYP